MLATKVVKEKWNTLFIPSTLCSYDFWFSW